MKKIILVMLFSVFLLSAFAGVQFTEEVTALEYTQYTGTLDGADWALRIPDPWNGMLVIICRGYGGPTTIPNPLSALGFGSYMLGQGFAVAASNYGAAGFCIQAGVNSTYELTMYVIDNYNVTGKVFLYGLSMGGPVALLLGEKYPDVYSGVLDLFGVKDLKDMHAGASRWANLTDEELTAELTALNISVPPPGFTTLEAFRNSCASFVAEIELETGGTPATHPQAYEDRSPTYHANIMIPVITVHGTSDASVPFPQSIMYQTAVANAGRSNLYRLYNVTGGQHASGDVMAEVPARFDELVAWSDALSPELTVGVNVGDWFLYKPTLVEYEADPGVPFPPNPFHIFLKTMNESDWRRLTVTAVSGTTITFEEVTHYKNGTETTSTTVENIAGAYTFNAIGANLTVGDEARPPLLEWPAKIINETIDMEYADTTRETNYCQWTTTNGHMAIHDIYWDKATGMRVKWVYNVSYMSVEDLGNATFLATSELIHLNVWVIPEYPTWTVMLLVFVAVTVSINLYIRKKLRH